MKKYEKALDLTFCLFLLVCSLWGFWFSLLAFVTPPDIFLPFIATDRISHVLTLSFSPVAIFMSGKALISGGMDSNRKLVNLTMGFSLFLFYLVAPILEICKELLDGKQLLAILNENEEILGSLYLVLMVVVVIAIGIIGKQISKLDHD